MIIEDIEIDFTNQETEMKQSEFIQQCLKLAPIYVGSIPDYKIKKDSNVYKLAKMKMETYHSAQDKMDTLNDLGFNNSDIDKLKTILKNYKISVAAHDYGKVYGEEAYLLIKKT
jgi:hypothetical protein